MNFHTTESQIGSSNCSWSSSKEKFASQTFVYQVYLMPSMPIHWFSSNILLTSKHRKKSLASRFRKHSECITNSGNFFFSLTYDTANLLILRSYQITCEFFLMIWSITASLEHPLRSSSLMSMLMTGRKSC